MTMEDAAMLALWRAYDKKLDESLVLNRKNAVEITKIKVQSLLASMRPLKIFTILAGLLWVAFGDMVILVAWHAGNPFLLVSAAIQVLLTKLAIGIYVYQFVLIHQADINAPVLETQEKLSRLISSTIWVTRILMLQLPVWTTFYLTRGMLESGSIWLYAIQLAVTALFTYAAVWFFINIRYENRDKKWFRTIFNGKEWDPVIRSMELLDEIKEYRNE